MSTERLTFKGGWWADIRTQWPYGADSKIAGALLFTDDPESFENGQRITLQQSVTAANLPDLEGNAIPFDPESMWDLVDGRVGRKVLARCRLNWGKWQKDADPNDDGPSSPESPPEPPSTSTSD